MKITVDLPDKLFEKTEVVAIRRRTSIGSLVVAGLKKILAEEVEVSDAVERLQAGYHLGGKPLGREGSHAR